MYALIIIVTFLTYSLAEEKNHLITCNDIKKDNAFGKILVNWFGSNKTKKFDAEFYLSTNRKKQPVKINLKNWSQLRDSEFDVSKKTFIITHGYLSDGKKDWVLNLKDALLEVREGNVIVADWSDGSHKKNYVNAARSTILASKHIFNFLQSLRAQVYALKGSSVEIFWNHLHFIGHSLGAHVSAQTVHLLKNDDFWKVERITGLDPAKPCFTNISANLMVDREDADFVDIYHTQIGLGYTDAFGLTEELGHVDFYFNGGFEQPECQGKTFGYQKRVCSHSLATKYFIESLRDEKTGRCSFPIRPWDGSYSDALLEIDALKNGKSCNNCPNVGMDAVNSPMGGVFLVLTGSKQPYCKVNLTRDIQEIIPEIKKLKGIRSIFDLSKT